MEADYATDEVWLERLLSRPRENTPPHMPTSDAPDGTSRALGETRVFTVGEVVDGRYDLRRQFGHGTNGTVFEAQHRFTRRPVVLKVLTLAGHLKDAAHIGARLVQETRGLIAARHPGIVDILDGGIVDGGTAYLVLEMIVGRTLESLLVTRDKLSPEDATGLALQLCAALGAAHRSGVVHAALKPANVFVLDALGRDQIKIDDFGITSLSWTDQRTWSGGSVLGAPEYLSPEQLLGETADARTDVYSVGVMIYECLAGVAPYGRTFQELLAGTADATPPLPLAELRSDVTPALSEVLARAVARKVTDRYQNVTDLARAISEAVPSASHELSMLKPRPPSLAAPAAERAPEVPSQQRRRTKRAPYSTPVRLVLPNGKTIDGRNEDISVGGMLVLSTVACEPGQRVTVRFALPIEGKVTETAADVRWVRASRPGDKNSPRAIGLEFVDLAAPVAASLARYVQLMTHDQPNE